MAVLLQHLTFIFFLSFFKNKQKTRKIENGQKNLCHKTTALVGIWFRKKKILTYPKLRIKNLLPTTHFNSVTKDDFGSVQKTKPIQNLIKTKMK